MKFEVGDKVRIKKFSKMPFRWSGLEGVGKWEGQTMTIARIFVGGRYCMEEDAGRWTWREKDFEKVEAEKMTRSDLKDGMVCEVRCGERYLWLYGELRGIWEWCSGTREDLTNDDSTCDIVKIYEIGDECTLENILQNPGELIWERQEPKEMTVAEIEEALGYPVKVVK